jgi:hypothetical protein
MSFRIGGRIQGAGVHTEAAVARVRTCWNLVFGKDVVQGLRRLVRMGETCSGRAGEATADLTHPDPSEIGYSLLVRRVLGAGSRSALPLRFSVIFEYGGLIP